METIRTEIIDEQLVRIKAHEEETKLRMSNKWLLSHNPELSECIKEAIYYTLDYVSHNRNYFNELPMTEEDLNTVKEHIDLFEESRAEDSNVLMQSIKGVLDRLVENSDKEVRQDIAKEFIFHLKKDGF